MRARMTTILSMAVLSLGLGASRLSAQTMVASICKDATTSTVSGRGACSGHGGVDAKATEAARKATKAQEKAAKKQAKAAARLDEKGESKAEKKAEKKAGKAGAMVTCTDGTASKGGRGACSSHGGIKKPS
jgi:hypothetical protein